MKTLDKAQSVLGNRDSKKLANNTYLHKIEGVGLGVRLHNTDVVTYLLDGTIKLDTGGWRTVTTKDRINTYTPVSIHSDRSVWYIGSGTGTWEESFGKANRVAFEDGMIVTSEGKLVTGAASNATVEATKKVDKLVSKYIAAFQDHIIKHVLEAPSNGDCWGCLFHKVDNTPKVSDLKLSLTKSSWKHDDPLGFDHYLNHFGVGTDNDGMYFVPSLLWNAILESGFKDPAFIFHLIGDDARRGRKSHHLRSCLTRFFKNRKPEIVKAYLEMEKYGCL